MFDFFKRRRRKKILQEQRIDEVLWNEIVALHPVFAGLNDDESDRLRDLTTLFALEKQFELVQGLELDDFQRLCIAAQATLPILNLGIEWYDDWSTLIIAPQEFNYLREEHDGHLIHETDEELAGQVLELGPIVFSWQDIEDSGWGDGFNVVIHEIAHKLDGRSGGVDGCPPLPSDMDYGRWKDVFTTAFEDLVQRTKKLGKRAGKLLPIDPYAITDAGEFFAVCSEVFFEQPAILQKEYPEVYEQMSGFYRQSPLQRAQAIQDASDRSRNL